MHTIRATALITLAALFLVAFPLKAAFGYETLKASSGTTGETRWSTADMPIHFSINEAGSVDVAGDSEFTAITNAFATWSKPSCTYLTSVYDGKTPDLVVMGDGKNYLDWVEADWPPEAGPQAIAFTTPLFFATGQYYEADIRFNGVNFQWTTSSGGYGRMDVETIALHELGHFFGLADLYDNQSCYSLNVVMCGYNSGSAKRALKQDDTNGICYLYPKGKNNLCATDADCSAQVCSVTMDLGGTVKWVCMDPIGTQDTGDPCGDVNNTPLDTSDDPLCKNLLCLESKVCTKSCATAGDCPIGMDCEQVSVKMDDQGHVASFKGCGAPTGCVRNVQCGSGEVCGLYRVGDGLMTACESPLGPGGDGDSCALWSDCKSGACYSGHCGSICDDNYACPPGGAYKCEKHTLTAQDGKSIDTARLCIYYPPAQDAGVDTGYDAGPEDTGVDTGFDSGFDAGPKPDAGNDAGYDAGPKPDAGNDAGHDAGQDAEHDAGQDAGHDAGHDAGQDAGHDAGQDTGHPQGDGGRDTGTQPVDAGTDSGKPAVKDTGGEPQPGKCDCDKTYGCDENCECDEDCNGAATPATGGCACSTVGISR